MDYTNQYQKYLNSSPNETQGSFVRSALGFTAISGAAYGFHRAGGTSLLAKYIAPALSKSRRLFETTSAFGKSIDEAVADKSLFSIFSEDTIADISKNFRSRMRDVHLTPKNSVGRAPSEFVRTRMELMYTPQEALEKSTGNLIYSRVMKQLNPRHGHLTDDMFDAIKPHLEQKNDAFFRGASPDAIRELVRKSGLRDTEADHTTDVIAQAIRNQSLLAKQYGSIPSFDNEAQDILTRTLSNVAKRLRSTFKESMRVQDTWFTRVMEGAGYQQLTVGEAVKRDFFNNTVIPFSKRIKGTDRTRVVQRTMKWNQKIESLISKDAELAKLRVDKNIFVHQDTGDIIDLRHVSDSFHSTLGFLANNFHIPFVNINPLRLAHWISWQGIRSAPFSEILRRGTGQAQPVLTGHTSPIRRDYLAVNDKVFDLSPEVNLVKDNVYRASARFGLFPRTLSAMAGLEREETRILRERSGPIRKLFDYGMQDSQSDVSKITSVFTKFWNPSWARNQYDYTGKRVALWNEARESGASLEETLERSMLHVNDTDKLVDSYRSAYNILSQKSSALSNNAIERLAALRGPDGTTMASRFGLEPADFVTRTEEETMLTIGKMVEHRTTAASGSPVQDLLNKYVKLYRDPKKFANSPRVLTDELPALPGIFSMIENEGSTKLVTQLEDARRAMHMDLLYQIQKTFDTEGQSTVSSLVRSTLTGKDAERAEELLLLNRMRGENAELFRGIFRPINAEDEADAANRFLGSLAGEDTWFSESLNATVKRHTPWWGAGPGFPPPEHFGNARSLVINKSVNPIKMVNEAIKSGEGIGGVIKAFSESTIGQLGFDFGFGFRAGRDNLDKVSTASVISYYMFNRLNEAIGKAGLGLSNKSLGSAQDAYLNLIGRRFLLPMATVGYLGYSDYLASITGFKPSEELSSAYVGARIDMAKFKDATGVTSMMKRWKDMFSGSDQLAEWLPTKAINFATFGLIGDTRSSQELTEYYSYGNDPARKGRYWGTGSNTPWSGGKVDYFMPNWYRRKMTDYMMSDVMYGSRAEYYGNQWYPTLENPIGPINAIIASPHHYAYKHKEDRPYPSTGGASILEELPLFGPLASKTLSMAGIAPDMQRGDLSKAHRQYLTDINESIKSQAAEEQGYAYSTASGGIALSNIYPGIATTMGGYSISPGGNVNIGGVPIIGTPGSGSTASGQQLTSINQGIISRGAIRSMRFSKNDLMRGIDNISDLDEVMSPNSLAYRAGETYYSLTEMAGIYGFTLTQMFGGENNPRSRNTLASASYMNSFGRGFWDQNLGGMGGAVSEIFRRFAPNSKHRRNQYNPYGNQMPDWLPGPEYIMDFRHGDPYGKIQNGEARLPGSGYERLNNLHPDEFGEYGAFDRFKILADVAPYSEQHKLYKDIVSRMSLNPLERKQVTTIKKQVSQQKKKYNLYPYKFRTADIINEEVNVTKVIDANTFMTAEHPDHPIRLAGIHVPVADEASAEARAEIEAIIYPGAKVQIGIDKDPLNRVRKDVLSTMHAVVYTPEGGPLQAKLLRTVGDQVTEKETDFSAVGVNARFYPEEITVGKWWEWFAHLDTAFHTKFLQVRSPLEMYKRTEVHGKAWQPWYDPWSGIMKPTLEAFAAKSPPIAALYGAVLGRLFGSNVLGRKLGTFTGAVTAGGLSTARVLGETTDSSGEVWIPKRRRKEREINEYFDMLKYVKYKGLYEKARKQAIATEGVDVEDIIADETKRGRINKARRNTLKSLKRWLKLQDVDGQLDTDLNKSKLKDINRELTAIDEDRRLTQLGPDAIQALYYNLQAKSTLYGVDPLGDMVNIYRALPKKDREFYQYFMSADQSERKEILSLVPKNQRRLYQARWGMEQNEKVGITDYFRGHYLPTANWEGWKANVSLEDIKLKVIKNEALDMSEFGYWPDDEAYAEAAPDVDPFKPSSYIGSIQTRLSQVLRGAGLSDIDVQISHGPAAEAHSMNVNVSIDKDRTNEIINVMNRDPGNIINV